MAIVTPAKRQKLPARPEIGLTECAGRYISYALPFSVLVPDNQRHGLFRGRILLTSKYRNAKAQAHTILLTQRVGQPMLEGLSLGFSATLYPPDKRRRDVVNYAKMVQDALTGIAYADDSQLDDVRWTRGTVDKANPRVEIFVWEIT